MKVSALGLGILSLACSVSPLSTIECGDEAWQEAPYSPVNMGEQANTQGCWMVVASDSGGVADREIDACDDATQCLLVGSDAHVWAYGRPGGVSEFKATDVACDAVCP